MAARATGPAGRDRRTRNLGPRGAVRAVRAGDPPSAVGRARHAVDRVALRRRSRSRRHPGDRNQPVGRLTGHRRGHRGRPRPGCADGRDHQRASIGAGGRGGSDDRPWRGPRARHRRDQDLYDRAPGDRAPVGRACRRPGRPGGAGRDSGDARAGARARAGDRTDRRSAGLVGARAADRSRLRVRDGSGVGAQAEGAGPGVRRSRTPRRISSTGR